MKKIAIIGSAGIPPRYGGFETLSGQLAVHLRHKFRLFVYCSSRLYAKEERIDQFETVKSIYLPFKPNGIQSILYDLAAMLHAIRRADVFLILGVSGGVFLPVIRLFFRGRIIVHPDGIEWKRQKWKWYVRKFLKLSEHIAVKNADIVIADNNIIHDYLVEQYAIKPALIEYGGNPVYVDSGNFQLKMEIVVPESYFLALGRIEPENHPRLILQTFKKLPDKNLVFIGNWENSKFGRRLYEKYNSIENIYLLDPVYDDQLLFNIRSHAQAYIHGHSAGGTNPSLVEAMWHGLPVFAFDVSFNREVTENKAGYFSSKAELNSLLLNTSENLLKEIRGSMSEIAHRRFKWEDIIKKYVLLLQELSK
jgi:glycosyltransferase involved in cell wall biosynthesis